MRRTLGGGLVLVVVALLALWGARRGGDGAPAEPARPARVESAAEPPPSDAAPEPPTISEPTRVAPPRSSPQQPAPSPEVFVWGARAIGSVIDYASGAPIEGALVEVESWIEEGSDPRQARTDAQGRFELTGLSLRGLNPPVRGLATTVRAEGYGPLFDRAYAGDTGRPRTVGETVELELGALRLRRGTIVTGRVVRDGAGVEGAAILLADLRPFGVRTDGEPGYGERLVRELGVSGADGRFELEEPVPATSSDLCLFAWSEQGLGWTDLPLVEGLAESDGVEIELDGARALSVEVVDARGEPIVDTEVLFSARSEPLRTILRQLHYPRSADLGHGRTDARGRWRVSGLPAAIEGEEWTVAVRFEDRRVHSTVVEPGSPDAPPQRIVVPDEDLDGFRALEGRVVDPDGRAFSGARVVLSGQELSADEDGRFRFEHIAAVRTSFTFEVSGAALCDDWRRVPEDEAAIELVLLRAAPIAGLATNRAGEPLGQVELELKHEREPSYRTTTWTDTEGRFEFAEAPVGESLLVGPDALPGNREPLNSLVVQGGERALHFVCDMQPEPTGRLHVRVFNSADGALLLPLDVLLSRSGTDDRPSLMLEGVPITRALGSVRVDELPAGSWAIRVRVPEWGWVQTFVEVPAGSLTECELPVGLAGSIAGKVEVDGSLEGTWMEFGRGSRTLESTAGGMATRGGASIDNESGRFRIENLLPGRYTLNLGGDLLVGSAVVLVRPGEEARVVLEVEAELTASMRISSDLPWEGGALIVRISVDGEERVHFKQGLEAGLPVDFEFAVPPGLVEWELTAHGGPGLRPRDGSPPRWEGSATLRAGSEWRVRLDD